MNRAIPFTPSAKGHAPAATASLPCAIDPQGIGIMAALCLLWSLQQISLKAAAAEASPMLMVALRSVIALALLAVLMVRRRELPGLARWRPGMVVGALFGLEYLLVSAALNLTQSAHVVVFLYTAPIFAALGLQWRVPAERLGRLQWIGTGTAFVGIAVAFLGGLDSRGESGGWHSLVGDALALAAGVAWGATTVSIRCSSLAGAPATEALMYQLLGALLLLPVAWFTQQWYFAPVPATWAHLAFQGVVVSFASFLTWCWMLRRYRAAQLGVFSFLTPLFGVVLGVWLLGESLSSRFLAGGALVLAGILLVSAEALQARRPPRAAHAH